MTHEPVTVPVHMDLTWSYASGAAMERFLEAVGEGRLEAVQCPRCGVRYLPPRPFCGRCRVAMADWVAVADTGTLEGWTVVNQPIRDGRTGELRPGPYGMGLIRLDGADTTLNHYLDAADPGSLRLGARVQAVWREERLGSMGDILHFEVAE